MTSLIDYASWTHEQLIGRVTKLEKQLRVHTNTINYPITQDAPRKSKIPRPARIFDGSRYHTRFIALKLAYLGQRYNGYEHHMNNKTPLPTIEEELWKALMKTRLIFPTGEVGDGEVNWEACEYSKCGRTDKGVSAFGQVVGIRVRSTRPKGKDFLGEDTDATVASVPLSIRDGEAKVDGREEAIEVEEQPWHHIKDEHSYPRLLNRVLPDDIRILAWCPSPPPNFSARFSCRERRYRYFFTQPAYTPRHGHTGILQRRTGATGRDGWLDIPAMQEAAKSFEGVHDFRNFCKIDPGKQIVNFERNIVYAAIEEATSDFGMVRFVSQPGYDVSPPEEAKVYTFTLHGSAFLWHQVRHMVAILFMVGQGLEKPEIVRELLDVQTNPGKPMYEMAADAPLVLWDCIFPANDEEQPAGVPKQDAMEWVYVDGQTEPAEAGNLLPTGGDGRYGPGGLQEVVWATWKKTKIDEVLAGSLLDLVAGQNRESDFAPPTSDDRVIPFGALSTKVFDGGNGPRLKGEYTPVMERERMEDVAVLNARYAERKGLPA